MVPAIAVLLLTACGNPDPYRIGFVGGLSGRVADLGIGGRDGVILAIEQRNRTGGIRGRQVELLVRDDRQDADTAIDAVNGLAAAGVVAIIGHVTSSMSVATVPIADRLGLVMVSPTTTSDLLAGLDDHFFRVISNTRHYAFRNARYQYQQLGMRSIAAVLDLGNGAYTENWYGNFAREFVDQGGKIAAKVTYESSPRVDFRALARQLVDSGADGVLILANSLDAAQLSQHLRSMAPQLRLSASEWAATERLIELGGRAVEGIFIAQFFDRTSQQPRYLEFRRAFIERFAREPGFPAVAGYDAATVVFDALAASSGDLKRALLERQPFDGLQGPIRIDRFGDSYRDTYLTTVTDGRFTSLEPR